MTNGVGAAGVAGVGLGAAGIILDIVSLSLALDQSDVLIEVKRDIEDIEKLCIVVHNKVFEKSDVEEPGKQIVGQGGEIVTTFQRVLQFLGQILDTLNESFIKAQNIKTEADWRQYEIVRNFLERFGEYFKERSNELQEMEQKHPFLFLGPLAKEGKDTLESTFDNAGYLASRKDLSSMEPVAMRLSPEEYADLIVAAIPEAVKRQREMGGAGVAGKTAEPEGRSVTEGDVIAIALAVAEKITGEAAQGAAGPGGEAAGRGQRDEEGRTLSDADIAAVQAAVSNSLSYPAGTGAGPGSGSSDLTQTVSANHEQLIQLLSAIKGGEDQIFLYQQLAYSDLVAIRNQLKEMGCDPISNMYDHRNMKI
jgi:hypothetical protein